ncbi:MAG TPA: 5'/3'-nucleotidase SurE [Nevskiaceae bacterium]|nr:5'/3'-nucleotidase SurE [Nevskiaceae bacterium]
MRVLVTNDDGIASPGLHALARRLADDGHAVRVLAPEDDCTGSGAGLGPVNLAEPCFLRKVSCPGLEDVETYAVKAPPALCVLLAFLGGFDDVPEIVASGINVGPNVGAAILHSGTLGAALTATHFQSRAVAISHAARGGNQEWAAASALAAAVVGWLPSAPRGTVINLNVPATRSGVRPSVRAARVASFDTSLRFDVASVGEIGRHLHWRVGKPDAAEGTDTDLLMRGFATLTAVHGIGAADTDVRALAEALE